MLNGNVLAKPRDHSGIGKVAWNDLRINAWVWPASRSCNHPLPHTGRHCILPASAETQPAVSLAAYPATLGADDWETLLKA